MPFTTATFLPIFLFKVAVIMTICLIFFMVFEKERLTKYSFTNKWSLTTGNNKFSPILRTACHLCPERGFFYDKSDTNTFQRHFPTTLLNDTFSTNTLQRHFSTKIYINTSQQHLNHTIIRNNRRAAPLASKCGAPPLASNFFFGASVDFWKIYGSISLNHKGRR